MRREHPQRGQFNDDEILDAAADMLEAKPDDRIEKAIEWRTAAVERRNHARRAVALEENSAEPFRNGAWFAAQESIIDGMTDRINVIDALFPEAFRLSQGKRDG